MALYKIGTAARLAGVQVATLRNWEQRYGVVVATRGPGRQRLYSREDIDRLRALKHSIDAGLSAGEAHNLLRQQLQARDGKAPEVRAEARRLRAQVADTHARIAEQHERAARSLSSLAEQAAAAEAPRYRRRAADARANAARARALAAASRERAAQLNPPPD